MIPLQSKGTPKNILKTQIGIIVKDAMIVDSLKVKILDLPNYLILSEKSSKENENYGVYNLNLNHLSHGDIVAIYPNGLVNTLFRALSKDNTIFMTNMCNQDCIMCSQPPSKRNDIESLFKINSKLIDLIPLTTESIGISGGEPSICGKYFGLILDKIIERIPNINICVLSNVVLMADKGYFRNLQLHDINKVIFSVPLYGDNQYTHDSIVRTNGSFYKTIRGIYNLFDKGFRVELRIIPQLRNLNRLEKITEFIYKNLTFVEQVAFMGIEKIGNASKNINKIWVSPNELIGPLERATSILEKSGITCTLYNYQNCVLSNKLRNISLSTISDWKSEYLIVCEKCNDKNICGGIFNSSLDIMKEYINPITDKSYET